ncbi:MAG: aminoglycoside phosphotransferase family protein, partial [Actinomycetota bacterium]
MTRTGRMHADELEIDEAMARRLLREQLPEWAELPLSRIQPEGTVNVVFRLGDDLSIRIPRHHGPEESGGKESAWLPRLAPRLPLEVPVPVAQGRPTDYYPWFWQVCSWVPGVTVPIEDIDATQSARDLAAFIAALQLIEPDEAPRGRGIPLADRDKDMQYWFALWKGDPAVLTEWERALASPAWEGPPMWTHGDIDVRNWLVKDGRISGIIDWEMMGVGDPACDVMVAWKLHSSAARDAFREALPIDDATWTRARGWVVSQAVAALAYYTPENNPALYREAEA